MGKHGRNNIRRAALAAAVTFGVAFGASGCGETGPEKTPSLSAGTQPSLEGGGSRKLTTDEWFTAQEVGDYVIRLLTDPKVTTIRINPNTVKNDVKSNKNVILVDNPEEEDFTVSEPQATVSYDRETRTLTTAVVGARTLLDDPKLPRYASAESTFQLPNDNPLNKVTYVTPEGAKSAIQSGVVPTGLAIEASPSYGIGTNTDLSARPLSVVDLLGTDVDLYSSK